MRQHSSGIFTSALLAAGLFAGALATWAPAHAQAPSQTWPTRTVKLILPLGPGSGTDISARLFADRLTKKWGQTVVVENRPGADGMIAINAVLSAKDDHTLLFGPSSSFVAHPWMHEKLNYDPRELMPIARVSTTLVGVVVPASLGVSSLKELMEMAKAKPNSINWATATGITDLNVAGYAKSTGLEMSKVPYRDTVQALNDVGEGRIQLYIAALAIVQSQVQAGRIKLIAVTNRERAANYPNVPTAIEAGFPLLEFDGLVGLYGARSVITPAIADKIAADVAEAAKDPEIVARLAATGQRLQTGNAKDFAAAIDAQAKVVEGFAKTLGIKKNQ